MAVIFLIIGVIRLLFSEGSDEDTKQWRDNILWVTIGIFVLQIAFSVWNTLLITDDNQQIDALLSWDFWNRIIAPIVALLQFLASFIFIAMMIYAFYLMVTGGSNEEKV